MAKGDEYELVGGVYRKKPKKTSFGDVITMIFGGLFWLFILGAILKSCAG